MKNWKTILIIAVIAAAAIVVFYTFARQENPNKLVLSGFVDQQEIHVGSRQGGRVVQVLVEEGSLVQKDQPLVRLDPEDLIARRAALEADLASSQANLLKLEHGARKEEIAQARASAAAAMSRYSLLKSGARKEEIAQAEAELAAAQAVERDAKIEADRMQQLFDKGVVSQKERDNAFYRYQSQAAQVRARQQKVQELRIGNREEEIQAAYHDYQRELARLRLLEAGTRQEEIAEARARVARMRAQIQELDVNIAESEIRSPAKARVEVISVRPGDLVQPGVPVMRLLEPDRVWVRVYVPEPKLGLVRVGQKAEIRIDTFPNRIFSGVVEQINSESEFTPRNVQSRDERNHQVFGVKIRIDNQLGEIKSGMAADVALLLGTQS
ncbi:MAG TPA: HlyD family efflux transporter periplasmic adaptor subunit [Acidobacteriota bacterium]|jgi:multidrug resistance efflux pump